MSDMVGKKRLMLPGLLNKFERDRIATFKK